MQYADTDSGRIEASPGMRGKCPVCGSGVIAKCGDLNIWHWAHSDKTNARSSFGKHRADVRNASGWIFEFQRSPLTPGDVIEREEHYGRKMCWVVDTSVWARQIVIKNRKDHLTFYWPNPRKCWWYARHPLLLQLNDSWLFRVCKVHPSVPCFGWGRLVYMTEFIDWAWGLTPEKRERYVCVCEGKSTPHNRCMICWGSGIISLQDRGFMR